MHSRFWAACLVTLAIATPAAAADTGHGKQLFQACAACHGAEGKGGTLGPSLVGVVGRKAGALDDFRYSNAMKRSDLVWDDGNLKDYVSNPQAKIKGNRMPFSGVASSGDAEDIVAYLKTLK
jgi:cytochrome c